MAAEVHRQTKMKNSVLREVWRSTAWPRKVCARGPFENLAPTGGGRRRRRSGGLPLLAQLLEDPAGKWQG